MPVKKFLTEFIWLDEFCRGHRQKSKTTNQTQIGQEQKSWFWGTKLGRGHPGTTVSSSHGGPAGLSLSTVARSGLAQRDVGIRAGGSRFGTIGPLWPKRSKVIGSQHPWINFLSVCFHCHKGVHGVWRKGEIFLRELLNNFVGVYAVTRKSSIFNCSSPLQVEVVDLDISRAWSSSRREQCQQLWRHCLLCLSRFSSSNSWGFPTFFHWVLNPDPGKWHLWKGPSWTPCKPWTESLTEAPCDF